MFVFKTMSAPSRAWPFSVRLVATVSCFLLCCMVVGLGMWLTHFGSFAALLCLPVALASWFFKQRGTFLCVGSVLLVLAVLNILILGSLSWPTPMLFGFVIGGTGYLVIGLFISFLAHILDLANQARGKAQQAEERLQQLHQIRDQFLLNVSHELRTPLTEIYRLPGTLWLPIAKSSTRPGKSFFWIMLCVAVRNSNCLSKAYWMLPRPSAG